MKAKKKNTEFIMSFEQAGEEGEFHTLFGRLKDDKKIIGSRQEHGMSTA
jgi:hypothetical protein